MKSRLINFFWGIVMVGAGVVFFLREFGLVNFELFSNTVWVFVFGILALFFLLTYFIKGIEQWGWLFPALIMGSVALTIGIEGTNIGDLLTGAPILASIAIPFLVAFALEPQKRRWALIPALVMLVLTSVVFLEDRINSNLLGTLVIYSIGLPFLVVYLLDTAKRWALIPFAALMIIGTFPLLETLVSGRIFEILVVGLMALPFFVVYFWSKKNWWALIPAGVFTSIVLTLLADQIPFANNSIQSGSLQGGVMLGGLGVTFGLLWLRRSEQSTDWAVYPTVILLGLAVLTTLFGNLNNLIGPIMLITVGITIVLYTVLKKQK